MSNNISAITDASFESDVHESDLPVLVDFWSPRSASCRQMMPVLEKLVATAAGAVRMVRVDIDRNPGLAQALGVVLGLREHVGDHCSRRAHQRGQTLAAPRASLGQPRVGKHHGHAAIVGRVRAALDGPGTK